MPLSPDVVALVGRAFPGASIGHVRPLTGGISAQMLCVELVAPDGHASSVIVRSVGPGVPRDLTIRAEADLLEHVGARGGPAPRVLAVDDTHLVLEFIDGSPRYEADDPIDLARTMARILRDIHAIDAPTALLPRRVDLVAQFLAHQPDVLDDALREPLIRETLQRAWPPDTDDEVLLHGDFWPGNLIWSDDALVGVIDWEDAAFGDRHSDVSITRLDLRWVFGPHVADAFTRAYDALVPLDPKRLALWDVVTAFRPCGALGAWAEAWPDAGRPDITEATMRAEHAAFLDAALASLGR